MHVKGEEKVPGGKLLRAEIEFDEIIRSVQITGDFFLHPEESLLEIEHAITGSSVRETESELMEKIEAIVREKQIEILGFTPQDLAKFLKRLMEGPE